MTSMLDRISNIVVSTYNQMYPEEAESARERGQRIRRAEERVIQEKPAYKKYFSHGTSHHLGLDTHDYCDLKIPFEKNNVLTVEPGIYIIEEGFGVRLEDDVVINSSGDPTNLMADIPIEIDHIESLMKKNLFI